MLTKTINNVEIKYEGKFLNICDLHFFAKNPRIMSELEKIEEGVEITQDLIEEIMWNRDETHTLYTSIKKDGGLNEALLVYKNQVIEGNTRLCCLRKLYSEDPVKWCRVPCEVIVDEISMLQINRLLIDKHVIGKNEWSAYNKALLYYQLKYDDGLSIDEITSIAHESSSTVRNRIASIEEFKNTKCDDTRKYSHFEQVVTNSEIKKIIDDDPEARGIIFKQILNNTIPKAQDVRKIPEIWRDKNAKKRFRSGNEDINEIVLDLESQKKFQNSPVIKNARDLKDKIKKMRIEDIECLKNNNQDKEDLRQLIKELVDLAELVEIRLPNKLRK